MWAIRIDCLVIIATIFLIFQSTASAQTTTIAPGDRILITLAGEIAFEEPFSVDPFGQVLLPEIGELELAGLTLQEATDELRDALTAAFRGAEQLEVRLVERRLLINVLGYVQSPGLVNIGRGETVQVAVSEAGGPRLGAQLDRVQHRRDGEVNEFNYKRYLETGDDALLPSLDSLDTIFVPASPLLGNVQVAIDSRTFEGTGDSDDAESAISVFGEVARPGVYSMRPDMNVLDVILRAGGVTRYAGVEQIRIIADGEPRAFNLKDYLDSGDTGQMPDLRPGAIIFVPNQSAGVSGGARTVYLMGEVQSPGAYELGPQAGMLDILANAGGPTRFADARNMRILHPDGSVDKFDLTAFTEDPSSKSLPEVLPGDALFIPEAAQDDETSWLSIPSSRAIYLIGAVLRPGRYEWSNEMTLLDLLAEGGGPTGSGDASAIEISTPDAEGKFSKQLFNLDSFRDAGELTGDLPGLISGSIVLVPELPQDPSDNKSRYVLQPSERSIYVLGAVVSPGRYAYKSGLSLLDVLSAAGGPLQNSNLSTIRHITNREGVSSAENIDLGRFLKTGDLALLPELAAEETVFVPWTGFATRSILSGQARGNE